MSKNSDDVHDIDCSSMALVEAGRICHVGDILADESLHRATVRVTGRVALFDAEANEARIEYDGCSLRVDATLLEGQCALQMGGLFQFIGQMERRAQVHQVCTGLLSRGTDARAYFCRGACACVHEWSAVSTAWTSGNACRACFHCSTPTCHRLTHSMWATHRLFERALAIRRRFLQQGQGQHQAVAGSAGAQQGVRQGVQQAAAANVPGVARVASSGSSSPSPAPPGEKRQRVE